MSYCLSDFGPVEMSWRINLEAERRGVSVRRVCNEIAEPLWEKGLAAPYLVKDYVARTMTAADLGLHPDYERRMEHERWLDETLARMALKRGIR